MAVRRSYGFRPRTVRIPRSRKNFKYRWKSITQRSLTEIEPSRKSAGRSAGTVRNLRRTDPSYGAAISSLPTNFGRISYGEHLNSPGSGQRREARLAQLRGRDARVQMREQSRRGERYVPVCL